MGFFLARNFWTFSYWVCLAALVPLPVMADMGPIDSMVMPGELIKGHAKYEGECKSCHKPFEKTAQNEVCIACHDHENIAKDIEAGQGYHSFVKKQECKECHTEHKGRDMDISSFDHKKFDHKQTDFPLRDAHAKTKIKCEDCHKAGVKYRDAPGSCNGCHKKDDIHKGSLGVKCADCHNERNWKEFRFDHSKTDYPLLGKHIDVKCKACHEKNQRYKDAPKTCNACHQKDDDKKGHKGKFGKKCESCHVEKDWEKITFDHDKDTKYPLHFKHQSTKCTACHTGYVYEEHLKTDCFSCHRKDDVHKGQEGKKCEDCHDERNWKKARFNHDTSRLPLVGEHKDVKCKKCHAGATYKDAPLDCIRCHKKDDVHKRRLGPVCELCHSASSWKSWNFDHNIQSKFPLNGGHKKPDCYGCHKEPITKKKIVLSGDCYVCHRKDDVHKAQEGRKCEPCHDDKDWKKAFFDHDLTSYPLLGKHKDTKCKKCHETQAFKDAKGEECIFCHKKEDADTHKQRLGTACEQCHDARDWKRWDFNHDKRSKFPLEGAHKNIDCYACHKEKVLKKKLVLAADCYSCHEREDVHNGAYGRFCEQCHLVSTFKKIKIIRGVDKSK
jgi:hypothetical protein